MNQPLIDAAVRIYADYADDNVRLLDVLALVDQCSAELDSVHPDALPDIAERVARQRLARQLAASSGHGEPNSGHI